MAVFTIIDIIIIQSFLIELLKLNCMLFSQMVSNGVSEGVHEPDPLKFPAVSAVTDVER